MQHATVAYAHSNVVLGCLVCAVVPVDDGRALKLACVHATAAQKFTPDAPNRLLNHLPATRLSATALEAFLGAAGYRLASAYGRQFQKLLAYIDSAFLGDLEKQGDPDARAVHSRLRTYIGLQQYCSEPEGRRMPMSDLSAREHA